MSRDKTLAVDSWESLFRAQVHVMRQLSRDFPLQGLSLSEYDVLFTLSTQPERTARMRDITKLVFLSQPSVSRLIDRIAGRGLVTKSPDLDDGRGTNVTMTELGFNTFRTAAVRHMSTISDIMSEHLSDDEMRSLASITQKLHLGPDRLPEC